MFFFILFIALLNIAVGYALAFYLHAGLTGGRWADIVARLKLPAWLARKNDDEMAASQTPSSFVSIAPAKPAPQPAASSPAIAAPPVPAAPVPPSEPIQPTPPTAIQESDVDANQIEFAVEQLKAELLKYRDEITTVDDRLRDCSAAPDESTVHACAAQLRAANHQYLEQRDDHRTRIEQSGPVGTATHLAKELVEAVDRQATVIEASQAVLDSLSPEADLLDQCRQMLAETQQITATNSELNSTIDHALAEIAQLQPVEIQAARAEQSSAEPAGDRAAERELQSLLDDFRLTEPANSRRIAVAMIDPDQLGRLNEKFGRATVDLALEELQRVVRGALPGKSTAARTPEQIHVLVLPDLAPRAAVGVVEQCRQQIDSTWFEHGSEKFRLTISGAVAEAGPEDDAAALSVSLRAMLSEAKRFGRNRTFFQEGKHPTPVVPPALAIEARTVSV